MHLLHPCRVPGSEESGQSTWECLEGVGPAPLPSLSAGRQVSVECWGCRPRRRMVLVIEELEVCQGDRQVTDPPVLQERGLLGTGHREGLQVL